MQDALALAIENNLDIELQRYMLPTGNTELLRAKGGGLNRGLNFTLAEVPVGTGGPLSPVLTTPAAAGRATAGSSVATSALGLSALGEPQINDSMQGTIAQSNGTPVPIYDPDHDRTVELDPPDHAADQPRQLRHQHAGDRHHAGQRRRPAGLRLRRPGRVEFQQQPHVAEFGAHRLQPIHRLDPRAQRYTTLLRGFGTSLNRRFIRIAGNEQRITSLLFQQQLILTVYGVIRLYTDFVALYEDEKVKQETLTLAEKLLSDMRAQVEEGTLAQVELTRANAQVFSARQDLINARGLREEQEAIFKNVHYAPWKRGPRGGERPHHPHRRPQHPGNRRGPAHAGPDRRCAAHRPDLGQARLQVANSQIGLQGARSLTRPEVDLVGIMQNNGLAGQQTSFLGSFDPGFIGGYGSVLGQVFSRNYPTYGIGLQVTLPIHNRIAEADLARDELQVKQSEIRLRQLQNQARLEVEDALIAMRRARASYEAASEARRLQEESLDAEQAKFEVGASTSFFVIQYESLLAQARSTEVAALSSYVKAKAALQRAMGSILDENHISIDAAIKGK